MSGRMRRARQRKKDREELEAPVTDQADDLGSTYWRSERPGGS